MKAFNFSSREAATDSSIRIFELCGYIDAHTVIEFEKAANKVIEGGTNNLILDISGLSYISSAGIGAMMGLARQLSQLGGDLVLLNPTPKVYSILDGLGFTKIFKVAANESEAFERLKNEAAS